VAAAYPCRLWVALARLESEGHPVNPTSGTVLFLCTGNYYRSRFAQVWFNHLAERGGLDWRATSAGLRIDVEQKTNAGPMSRNAVAALEARSIDPEPHLVAPRAVRATDLMAADVVVGMLREEHEPMIRAAFAGDAVRVVYWDIRDVPPSEEYDPLAAIDRRVRALIETLSEGADGTGEADG